MRYLTIGLSLALIIVILGAGEPAGGSNVLDDGDFETVAPGNRLPRRWVVLPEAAKRGGFQIVGGVAHKGKRCLRLDPTNAGKEIYGILQPVPTDHLRGKRVTLRGRVRTDGLAGGGASAGMALVIGGPKLRTVPADTGGQFRELSVTREVPADARQVVVLLMVRGTKGHAYFDDVELLVPGASKTRARSVKITPRSIAQLGRLDPRSEILFRSNRWADEEQLKGFVPCELYTMRNDGSQIERLTYSGGKVGHIDSQVSPDRTMVLVRRVFEDTNRDGQLNQLDRSSVWVIDLRRKKEWRLSPAGRNAMGGSWFPDGKRVVMCIEFGATPDIYTINVDGTELKAVVETPGLIEGDTAVSPDGKRIAFNRIDPSSRRSTIWVVGADGSNPRRVTDGGKARGTIAGAGFPMGDYDPEWSPDGRLIVFGRGLSAEGNVGNGVWNICVTQQDGLRFRNLTNSRRVEGLPSFSPDGKRIVFMVFSLEHRLNDIMTMRADGTDQRRLTDGFGTHDFYPSYIPRARSGQRR